MKKETCNCSWFQSCDLIFSKKHCSQIFAVECQESVWQSWSQNAVRHRKRRQLAHASDQSRRKHGYWIAVCRKNGKSLLHKCSVHFNTSWIGMASSWEASGSCLGHVSKLECWTTHGHVLKMWRYLDMIGCSTEGNMLPIHNFMYLLNIKRHSIHRDEPQ